MVTIRQQDHVFISGICEQAENGERIEAASRRRPGPASQRHLATRLRQCGNEERLAESSHGSSGTRPAGGPGPAGAQQSCKQTFAKFEVVHYKDILHVESSYYRCHIEESMY